MAKEKRLIDANDCCDKCGMKNYECCSFCIVGTATTVDAVEVAHGWWIELPGMEPDYECSECGRSYAWWEPSEARYCPNCGARMDKGEET